VDLLTHASPRPAATDPVATVAVAHVVLDTVAAAVDGRLADLLTVETARYVAFDESLTEPIHALTSLIQRGGKRLRPAFCHMGWQAAGGRPLDPVVLDAGVAIELLHAFALLHDDVMDGSLTRRGAPAAHVLFAAHHSRRGWRGDTRRFGDGIAILLGDLAHVLADRVIHGAPPEAIGLWDDLRVELTLGQFLDVMTSASGAVSRAQARRIARCKSGRYTILRPLQLGSALAGKAGDAGLARVLHGYGDPLGEAFQLRDDLLGTFGDEARTGKPSGDDLRDGKPTLLLAIARERSIGTARRLLDRVGAADLSDADVARLQQVLVDVGAVTEVEYLIDRLTSEARTALASAELSEAAVDGLLDLADLATRRSC
jgi:geranylgeranyl diphosphate synthase type I